MHIGLIGLGKMGGNMRARLIERGITVVGFDPHSAHSDALSIADLVERLATPRLVWVMVPAGEPTKATVAALADVLSSGDLVIDGGNSRFTEDAAHDQLLNARGIGYIDCGVSGGVWGLDNGYALMVGGRDDDIERAQPVFDALRPDGPAEQGFVHVGPVGAGHFAKMVHNGVEYGLMQAYAEGLELLRSSPLITDPSAVIAGWQRGTVIRSWLLELLANALHENPDFEGVSDHVADSGEGRWAIEEALELQVPVPVIAAALFARFGSRQETSAAMQAVAVLRDQFGGHGLSSATPQSTR